MAQNSRFLSYEDAKYFVHKLNLSNVDEWRVYAKSGKKPGHIPGWPYQSYKGKGWMDWGDWLGSGNICSSKRKFLPFHDARSFAQELQINGKREWMEISKSGKKPFDIPTAVNKVYEHKGWNGWEDFLGKKKQ